MSLAVTAAIMAAAAVVIMGVIWILGGVVGRNRH
ncbi:hypothetical protein SAMN05421543_11754 [Alicyclobacillus macrosporangiidus]|jgi:hypothetical protein|uniref:Uncharacterized protein n=1 Tax=Alicyclobacillus macrosporangiidus TaxID=392015 RepID=A0A1I7KMV3_9BACL|nr:hypothetical protein SAMN05421543_11754 [Alicyclobacillus macrosporangiidus]